MIIKNGTIVTGEGSYLADVLIRDEKIVAIGKNLEYGPEEKVIDATDLLVLPGAIDAHTHLQMVMGKTMSADSYESGTRAAACGGVTTVIDYTLQEKGGSILQMIKEREELCAPSACVDFSFHGGISDVNETSLKEMEEVVAYGIPSFKVYMAYDFGINDAQMYQVLKRAKEVGALITVHAENKGMIEAKVEEFKKKGTLSAWYHYLSRPERVEEEADFRAIQIAKEAGAPLYIVHLGSAGGLEIVKKAREDGAIVIAETCPHYLKFNCDVFKKEDGYRYICSPPMKGEESRQAIWKGIINDDIQTIATDHCPSMAFEKEWGKNDFTKAPNGLMGIENMYPYLLSEANQGHISFEQVVKLCATNVAKIFGMYGKKGAIMPLADADIVLYDRKKSFTITKEAMHSEIDYTVWEGTELSGYPVLTMVRGNIVYQDGRFIGEKGIGKFVKREPFGKSMSDT